MFSLEQGTPIPGPQPRWGPLLLLELGRGDRSPPPPHPRQHGEPIVLMGGVVLTEGHVLTGPVRSCRGVSHLHRGCHSYVHARKWDMPPV